MINISITLLIFFMVGMPLYLLSSAYRTFSRRLESEYWVYPNKQKQHFMQDWALIITYIAFSVVPISGLWMVLSALLGIQNAVYINLICIALLGIIVSVFTMVFMMKIKLFVKQ